MSSIYGKKVVAVLDTTSNFGIQFQTVVDNVSTLSNQMSTLLADSPDSLNTLNEIADALGDDPAFFSTMATANTTLQTNIDALATAAASARTTLQTALSGRLDTLESDPTTATALSALGTSLTAVDVTLAGRLDVLESDPTTKTYVDAQVSSLIDGAPDLLNTLDELAAAINDDENVFTSLTSADTALSARITTLEADPTTATALAAVQTELDTEESTRATNDAALSTRINALEADPTTQAALDAVNQSLTISLGTLQDDVNQNEVDSDAGIALKFDKTGGTLTGNLVVNRDFPDVELKSNGEKRLLFTDAGGGATGAIKHVGSSLDFYAGGITSGNKELVVASTGITISNALTLSGGLTDATDDGAAATAGVAVGQLYRNGSVVMIRVS